MITISPSVASINMGDSIGFTASGGTAPYTFSVLSGGGSIDPVTGIYIAPPESGVATVQVIDSLLATAAAQLTINTALTLLCDVIKTEMGLANDQVFLWDQKFDTPKDQRLYIAVAMLSCKPFANTNEMVAIPGVGMGDPGFLNEVQSVNMLGTASIDIMSRSAIARDRKEEIILALKSTYAEQLQEANGFFIATISSSFVNLSSIDGAAIPYRFNISVNIQYKVVKTKAVPYYDNYTDSVITDP